jgi:Creatinase/Prolidase N-terminal domain
VPDVSVNAAEDVRVRRHRVPLNGRDADVPRRPKELGENSSFVPVRSERYEPDACRKHQLDPTTSTLARGDDRLAPMAEQSIDIGAGLSAVEFRERRERLLEHVKRHGLSGYVLFGADYIQYFAGFWFLSNERPVIYAASVDGGSAVFVPEFEVERTRAEASFARVESYPEYPGPEHPMTIFARVLSDLGIVGSVGADQDGYPGILG